MTIEIRDENLLVSVEVPEEVEGCSFAESVFIAVMQAIGHACPAADIMELYCHVDPDRLDVRDDDNPLWQAYQKHKLCYYRHLKCLE